MGLFIPIWMTRNHKKVEEACAAAKQLTDQGELAKAAIKAPLSGVRSVAAERLTDQGLLARIAFNESDEWVRWAAVQRISGQGVLAQIAFNDSSEHVRKAAMDNLCDQSVLLHAALHDRHAYVQKAAAARLTDQIALISLVEQAPHLADEHVAELLTDEAALAKLACTHGDRRTRIAALNKLTDQAVIVKIARNDSVEYIRKAAVRKITDRQILTDIALSSDFGTYIFDAAVKRLNELTDRQCDHEWKELAGRAISICEKCGVISVKNHRHEWEQVEGKCVQKCRICSKIEPSDDLSLHRWVALPNCRKKCSVCGAVAYDHDWVLTYSPVGDSWLADTYTCKKCGERASEGGQGGGKLPEGLV